MYFLLKPDSPPLLCWTRASKSTFWKRTQGFYTWIQSMLPSLANIEPSHSRSDTSPGVSNDLERHDNILQRSPSYCHPLLPTMQWNAAADETRRGDSGYLGSGPQGCHLHDRGLWERHVTLSAERRHCEIRGPGWMVFKDHSSFWILLALFSFTLSIIGSCTRSHFTQNILLMIKNTFI